MRVVVIVRRSALVKNRFEKIQIPSSLFFAKEEGSS